MVDGDHILAILALDLDARGALRHRAIATTVMANLGLTRALEPHGIDVIVTPVGDRHVLAAMEDHDLVLGGEQSGHVIASAHAVTGDGPLTGILLLEAVVRSGRPLARAGGRRHEVPPGARERAGGAPRGPRRRRRASGPRSARPRPSSAPTGGCSVRPSGTEPVVRVMVEAGDEAAARRIADELAAALHAELG